jgi:hypothetical protein
MSLLKILLPIFWYDFIFNVFKAWIVVLDTYTVIKLRIVNFFVVLTDQIEGGLPLHMNKLFTLCKMTVVKNKLIDLFG